MTEHWVSPVGHDRTRPVASGGLLEVTGRWGPTSDHDPTDAFDHEWNLTRNDQTLVLVRPVTSSSVSGHHLTVEIGRSAFEADDTWQASDDRTLGSCVRSVTPRLRA